jgi:nucleoside-diphosphate-sugar epimerase
MKKVVVTGGSGRAGHFVLKDLIEHGYDVVNVDIVKPSGEWLCPFRECDMSDYGQAFAVLHGFDAVVHLAADPRPDYEHFSGAQRFHNNTLGTYNVFNAAVALGMERMLWASSETLYGFPFDVIVPDYVPVNEQHTYYPQSSYALSKLVGETMAQQFSRLSGILFIGLQFSNIVYEPVYAQCPQFTADPKLRIWNLWSYIDYRDVAQSVRLSLEADISGSENFIIVADDTIINRPSADLLREYFPTVAVPDSLGTYQSLMSNAKAKQILGFQPQYTWRDYVAQESE